MSGSSKDGIDASLIYFKDEVNDFTWETVSNFEIKLPASIQQLLSITADDSIEQILSNDALYSAFISQEIKKIQENFAIDYLSIHGHTVLHLPAKGITFQMGSAATISALTGIHAMDNFRLQDIAKGGVGTPLAPLADNYLYKGYDAYINIGGIANVTITTHDSILGYDICPANQVLNYFAQKLGFAFDNNGESARIGQVNNALLQALIQMDYMHLPNPKSLDNNWIQKEHIPFIHSFGIATNDVLHTYVHFMVHSMVRSVKASKCKSVFVTGGGIHNLYLRQLLQQQLEQEKIVLKVPSTEIINFKESILMALIGFFRVTKRSNVLESVTGASSDSIGGSLYLANGK